MLPHERVLDHENPIPFVDAESLILLESGSPRSRDRTEGSTNVLRGGLYDATSDEIAQARNELTRIQ